MAQPNTAEHYLSVCAWLKGCSSQDRAQEISRDQDPSPDQVDPSVGEEGELASEEEDPDLHQGDPNLTQLVMTEEEQQDFDSF